MSKDNIKPEDNNDEEKGIISRLMKKDNFLKIIIFMGLIGIALIFLSSFFKTPSENISDIEETSQPSDYTEKYRQDLCNELGNMIASIDGAGKTKIMLTMEQSIRNVYASDKDTQTNETSQKNNQNESTDKKNSDKSNYIIIRQSDGSEKVITVSQIMPKVKGVLVVCEGGENAVVKKRITEAVCAILNISSSHICVTKLDG